MSCFLKLWLPFLILLVAATVKGCGNFLSDLYRLNAQIAGLPEFKRFCGLRKSLI
jgi:hypothetical protein